MQEYSQGKKKASVKKLRASKLNGTIVTFKPDTEIFKDLVFNLDTIVGHLRGQAYLVKGLRIRVIDARAYTGKLALSETLWFSDLGIDSLRWACNTLQRPARKQD